MVNGFYRRPIKEPRFYRLSSVKSGIKLIITILPTIAPSYSTPFYDLKVIGDNEFQTIVSQTLVAIYKEIALPNPYPY